MNANYVMSLVFVWQPQFDSPDNGYYVTPGDPGGGTKGGVTEATWAHALSAGTVTGSLQLATTDQLGAVLRAFFWGPVCDALPSGLDLLVFNGRMMSGYYPKLLQQGVGFIAGDVDGWIGPQTLERASLLDPKTLISAVSGSHYAYLASLSGWAEFGNGWTNRITSAMAAALQLVGK